ncbi:MAG: hypothetical protein JSV91_01330 [Phycisphaerales bacterium]|nr:MAG: hypothetical protein JSV91_01330 [Phycisphaerales bacterium]
MRNRLPHGGFTILELAISLALIVLLLAILLPALAKARVASHRDHCVGNQRQIGTALFTRLEDHDERFPYVPVQPDWRYAGVRFSSVNDEPFLDYQRPLTHYLPVGPAGSSRIDLLRCPADRGISGETGEVGTAGRTAFRAFGTSYRANACLFDAHLANHPPFADTSAPRAEGDAPGVSPPSELRGLARFEITTPPSRMVMLGDPFWYEVLESTGRQADWHGQTHAGNLLFLDGSVRFMTILPRPRVGPAVFDPVLPGTVPLHTAQDAGKKEGR